MQIHKNGGLPVLLLCVLALPGLAAEWTVESGPQDVSVKVDGAMVTKYLIKSGAKPILWPLIGPNDVALTRAYPLNDDSAEQHDHIHQRSCWFSYGSVNEIDFWSELEGH